MKFILRGSHCLGLQAWYTVERLLNDTRSVRKVSVHFEYLYLENRSRGLDVTWQPVRGDLSVHP